MRYTRFDEIFNSPPYPYRRTIRAGFDIAIFKTKDDRIVEVLFEREPGIDERVEIGFTVDGQTDDTGEGDELRILATVAHIVREYIDSDDSIETVGFQAYNAKSPSRAKVFHKMILKFGKGFRTKERAAGAWTYWVLSRDVKTREDN